MSGAPSPDPFSERQLQALTRIVDRQLANLLSAGRPARAEYVRDVRLAKTVSRGSSYPEEGDTFWIRFVDCGFSPKEPGTSTMSCTDRTAEGDSDGADDVLARELNGHYLEEGTYVYALWQRGVTGDPEDYGEWWII